MKPPVFDLLNFKSDLSKLIPDSLILEKLINIHFDAASKSLIVECFLDFQNSIENDKKIISRFKTCLYNHFFIHFTNEDEIKVTYHITTEENEKKPLLPSNINNSSFTFIDRNIARNPHAFAEYGKYSNLIFTFLIYAFERKKVYPTLYGVTTLDPYDFINYSGFSRTYLFSKVENPLQEVLFFNSIKNQLHSKYKENRTLLEEELIKRDGYIFSTILEDMLYQAFKTNLTFVNTESIIDSVIYRDTDRAIKIVEGKTVSITSVRVIGDLRILHTGKGRNQKKIYDIFLDESFYNNLKSWFNTIDKSYIHAAINRKYYDFLPFYVWLQDLKEICRGKGQMSVELEFDFLVYQAGYNCEEAYNNKKNLISLFKKINEFDKTIMLKWLGNGKHSYKPVIIYKDISNKSLFKEINQNKVSMCFNDFILKCQSLYKEFVNINYNTKDSYENELFYKWLLEEKLNQPILFDYFVQTMNSYFKGREINLDRKNFEKTIENNKLSTQGLF